MANHAIHWGEGLFLRPHHFQASERGLREQILLSEDWNTAYAYGLRSIDIDEDALVNWRVVVRACHLRLHDGTHVRFPEDADLNPVELPKDTFNRQESVTVYLALPRLKLGHKNADAAGGDPNARYRIETQEIEDENQAGNSQPLEVRWPNVRLIVGDDELSGYEALPIMRLTRSDKAEAPPQIDREYIPPVLACDAWSFLQHDIIDSISSQIGGRVESETRKMFDRNISLESGHREDLQIVLQLNALNTALGYLWNLSHVKGVHPLVAYMELCRVVGMLAIFRPERRMPELPRYDHDNLGPCFLAVKRWLEGTEAPGLEPVKRLFVGAGKQTQVRLDREWLEPSWQFFIGVESQLSYTNVVKRLRELNMKVASSEKARDAMMYGKASLRIDPVPDPPRSLPGGAWTYWKVDRNIDAWQHVEDSLELAICIIEDQIDGRIDGEEKLHIKSDEGRPVSMTFALFAMPTQNAS